MSRALKKIRQLTCGHLEEELLRQREWQFEDPKARIMSANLDLVRKMDALQWDGVGME